MTPQEFAAAFTPEKVEEAFRPLFSEISEEMTQIAREEVPVAQREVEIGPVKREPGGLLASLKPILDEANHRAGTGSNSLVAVFMQGGTDAHSIVARHETANGMPGHLAFMGSNGMAFPHAVEHPGTAPNPFMTRTQARVQPRALALAIVAGSRLIKSIAAAGGE